MVVKAGGMVRAPEMVEVLMAGEGACRQRELEVGWSVLRLRGEEDPANQHLHYELPGGDDSEWTKTHGLSGPLPQTVHSGTVDATTRSTAIGQQQQGKTAYHISVILNETQGDVPVSGLEMGRVTHTLVENCQPGGEIISVMPMENSPRLGRARQELDRWPSLSCTGRAGRQREEVVVEENEEELEEVEGKMKTDRFLKQPSKNPGNSSQQDRDVAESAAQTDTKQQHIRSSALRSVTTHAKGLVFWEHGTVAGHSSLPRACVAKATAG
ncbi:hypothetical protein L3Q82_006150 [Scortum barcoo]|uniref:Uncharacterized protein n=1 Tax=Scortum barcoo TaxID=214431 RepID=A0ACB8X2K0_9TELE|nr:hypothetical protein L3Q82_006150 [Scortum barcoo]